MSGARALIVGDRIFHKRALAEGDAAEDEVVAIDDEKVSLTGGTIDDVSEWEHADGSPIESPWP